MSNAVTEETGMIWSHITCGIWNHGHVKVINSCCWALTLIKG